MNKAELTGTYLSDNSEHPNKTERTGTDRSPFTALWTTLSGFESCLPRRSGSLVDRDAPEVHRPAAIAAEIQPPTVGWVNSGHKILVMAAKPDRDGTRVAAAEFKAKCLGSRTETIELPGDWKLT